MDRVYFAKDKENWSLLAKFYLYTLYAIEFLECLVDSLGTLCKSLLVAAFSF